MPYEKNSELPKSIREALPKAAQSVFRSVVNSQLQRGLSEEKAFASAWTAVKQGWEKINDKWVKKMDVSIEAEIKKLDEDQKLVFGWASIIEDDEGNPVVDSQGDIIKVDELEKAAYNFVLEARKAGEMHKHTDAGMMVESVILTKEKQEAMGISTPIGWWVGFKLSDDVFAKVKAGDYKGFSIGGKGLRRSYE